jgi:hypothetical protein
MKYEFKSTGDKKIDSIVKQFDKQIKKEYKNAGGDKERCPSYWHKLLFLKTMNLDLTDWMKIRTGDYWEKRDLLQGVEQIKFVYKKVTDYLG